ncbi:MAG: Xaa-Pro peptidase family protein [Tannerella sp.]|jgi:Xaa-Pro aminopeptidase|nr:Xaa-Pro peptidase family protein [Tannerella sp.]
MNTTTILQSEFEERIRKFQANIKKEGLDACLVHATESDMAHVRYLSEYWPVFETAAVFMPAEGEPVLLVGPESDLYASRRSFFKNIEKLIEYRESAEPDAPGMSFINFKELIAKYVPNGIKKLGIVGWAITSLPVYTSLKEQLSGVELIKADMTLWPLRFVKSEGELACMRRAFQISELAVEAILNEIKPGMTELQVIGIAQREIYKHGGEYEGHSLYCFCGQSTNHAISRPTHNKIVANEVIQLNIGARVSGYSSSVGLPFSIGPLPERKKRLVEFGLEAHKKTIEMLRAGIPAGQIVNDYESWVKERGFGQYLLYGPCHSIGMMEVERPWMESTSDYLLEENMTFQIDTFFYEHDFGLRWENGAIIKEGGAELMSSKFMKMIEI